MTDLKFQKAINKAQKYLINYHESLKIAEFEYERRYGHHPSDKDNDEWIDAMHVNAIPITVAQVKTFAELCD